MIAKVIFKGEETQLPIYQSTTVKDVKAFMLAKNRLGMAPDDSHLKLELKGDILNNSQVLVEQNDLSSRHPILLKVANLEDIEEESVQTRNFGQRKAFILNIEYRQKRIYVGLNVGSSTTVQQVKEMLCDRYQEEWKGVHNVANLALLKEGHVPLPNAEKLIDCGVKTDGNVSSALLLSFKE